MKSQCIYEKDNNVSIKLLELFTQVLTCKKIDDIPKISDDLMSELMNNENLHPPPECTIYDENFINEIIDEIYKLGLDHPMANCIMSLIERSKNKKIMKN